MSLVGKRILITRPEAQSSAFIQMLNNAHAVPIVFPTIAIEPISDNTALESALSKLDAYDWAVFTSVNGVRLVLERMQSLGLKPAKLNSCRVAAIGPATAAELQSRGIRVDLQPERYIAESIFESLVENGSIAGKRFLLLRADIARATLREQLSAKGGLVDEIAVYNTVKGNPDPESYAELRAGVDIVTFTSSSTVRYFFELLGSEALPLVRDALVACIGPITAQTAQEFGLKVDLVAEEYTIPGLLKALSERMSA